VATPAPTSGFKSSMRTRTLANGDIVFDVRYRDEGKQKTKTFDDVKAAERWQALLAVSGPARAEQAIGAREESVSPLTVAEVCRNYIDTRSGVTDKTISDYRMYLRRYIEPAFGAVPIQALNEGDIAMWVTDMEDMGSAGKTIQNRVLFFAAVCKYAIAKGYIHRSPVTGVRLPDTTRQEIEWLTPDEFDFLLGYVPPRHELMIATIASTGLRWGEVSALGPEDIDLKRKTLRVARAFKLSPVKGLQLGAPKTKSSRRTVPLPEELIDPLGRHMSRNRKLVFVNTNGDPIGHSRFRIDAWLPALNIANGQPAFYDHVHNRPVKPRPGGVWDRPVAEVPLGKYPRIHDLRHSHASWLIQSGLSLMVVQRRLGHESAKTTMDIYGHLAEEHSRQAATAVSGLLSDVFKRLK